MRRSREHKRQWVTVTRALGDVWGGANLLPLVVGEGLTMESLEPEIAEWRAFVGQGPAVDGRDVEELEAHLRDQIADLDAAGLAADEAFLIAVKRMGSLDELSREFAREHSGRLWRQLVLSGDGEQQQAGQPVARGAGVRRCGGRHDPGRTPDRGIPERGVLVAAAEREPARAAVPRRLLRPPTATLPAPVPADGRAVR